MTEDVLGVVAGKLPEGISTIADPHVTLVYFGGVEPTTNDFSSQEALKAGFTEDDAGVDRLGGLHEALLAMDGESVDVYLDKIIVAPTLVCALVSFDEDSFIPAAHEKHHVTLGVFRFH